VPDVEISLSPQPSPVHVDGRARDGLLETRWLGRIEYRAAWDLQKQLVSARAADRIPDQLLLLEHPPVLTLGRSSDPSHILADPSTLAARGIEVVRVERGGEVTYHGPGQLVAYPIVALGLRVERGVSYHGIALNITVDLDDFDLIDPCGMPGVPSTSVAAERDEAEPPSTDSVARAAAVFAPAFADRIGARLEAPAAEVG